MTDPMTFRQLREANIARQKEWGGGEHIDLAFRAVELGGEVGELLNIVKKLIRSKRQIAGNTGLSASHIGLMLKAREEVGDVLICLDLLCMELEIDLARAGAVKFNLTSLEKGMGTFIQFPDGAAP